LHARIAAELLTGRHLQAHLILWVVQLMEAYKDTALPPAPLRSLRRVVVVTFPLCQLSQASVFIPLDILLDQVSTHHHNGITHIIPLRNCAVGSVDSCLQLLEETRLRRYPQTSCSRLANLSIRIFHRSRNTATEQQSLAFVISEPYIFRGAGLL
jgi:hypothetical protein